MPQAGAAVRGAGAPIPGALGTSLVRVFSIQVCWGTPSAESAGAPADKGLTTGFHAASIEGGPSSGDCAPSTPLIATADTSLDPVFANQQGPGWLGGDATYSTALPKGKEALVFSDTSVGTGLPDGQASLTGVAHNSEMTGRLPNLGGDLNGEVSSPVALVPDQDDPSDSWQVASTTRGGPASP